MLSVDVKSINLNKFEKLNQIGEGGFGIVYEVVDKRNDQKYAAKVAIANLNKFGKRNKHHFKIKLSINFEVYWFQFQEF